MIVRRMAVLAYIDLIFCLCMIIGCGAVSKPYKLLMLNIGTNDTLHPDRGSTCRGAAEYVLTMVNNQTELLTDYELIMETKDGGDDGSMAAQVFASYVRSFKDGPRTMDGNVVYESPVTVGPIYSRSCASIGKIIHHIDLVTIATGCSDVALINHAVYPNLYMMMPGYQNWAMAIYFVRAAARWSRFAILTSPVMSADHAAANETMRIATSLGLTLSYSNVVIEPNDEAMIFLKESRARIVAIYSANPQFLLQFLCQSYRFGLTGPKYVFIMNVLGFVEPEILGKVIPTTCNQSHIIEQYKYTFFASALPRTVQGQEENVINYDRWIDRHLNYTKPVDYYLYKYICHDTYIRAVIALDSAERALKARNMSLRDFRTNPETVMKYVNNSVANTNYSGYALAPLKLDNDKSWPGVICHWSPSKSLSFDFRIEHLPNTQINDIGSYRLVPVMKLDWEAYGGQAPRDGPISVSQVRDLTFPLAITIASLAGVDILLEILALSLNLYCWLSKSVSLAGKNAIRISIYFPMVKTFGYIGCVLLDIAAILFSVKTQSPYGFTIARSFCLVAAVSTINAVQSFRILLLEQKLSAILSKRVFCSRTALVVPQERGSIFPIRKTGREILALTPDFLRLQINLVDKIAAAWSLIFTACYLIVTLIWLIADPLHCTLETLSLNYLEKSDTEVITFEHVCRSEKQPIWMITMWLSQIMLFPLAFFSGDRLRHRFPSCPEHKIMRIGVNNTMATQMAVVVILFILHRNQIWVFTALSFGCLALSLLSSLSWTLPILMRLFRVNRIGSTH